jgi:TRAP-type C4-dicarboxylate transport system permease small subunit
MWDVIAMGARDSLRLGSWITVAVLLAGGWIILTGLWVADTAALGLATGETVGQTVMSGVIGLLVMFAILLLAFVLYGELGEQEPEPETFPPQQDQQ